MFIHCFFEQSGVFKKEFVKLGYSAYDYDIKNDFGCTDYIVDLFLQIENCYQGEPSIFDLIKKDDLIFAFFPCVRFSNQALLWFCGNNYAQRDWTDKEKLIYSMKCQEELSELYLLLCKLFIICLDRGIKLVVENPYHVSHYLTTHFCIKPSIIDKNRRENGDYFIKPTQYWFINFEPKNNFVFESLDYLEPSYIVHVKGDNNYSRQAARSLISSQYANRFIRQYLINL